MKIKNIILAIIFLSNTVSAQQGELAESSENRIEAQEGELAESPENQIEAQQATADEEIQQPDDSFRKQLISDLKAQHGLSFFDDPLLSIYASSCDEQSTSSTQHSLKQICNVVVSSEECKNVEPKEDLLSCSNPQESKSFDPMDFIIGCGKGLWNSVVDFFNFIWTIIRNATDIPGEFMEYVESAKLYLVNEYDKAYEEASSFKTLTAIKTVASNLGEKVYHAIQEMAKTEYTEFGCLNFQARTKKVCTLLGAFLDPFVLLKALKLGRHIVRVIAYNEKAGGKVLQEARERLNMTKKDVKEKKRENKRLISEYNKSGDIERGVVEVGYIGRNGETQRRWIRNTNSQYVRTESGRMVPRNQVLYIHRNEDAVRSVAEHQRIRDFLKEKKRKKDIWVKPKGKRKARGLHGYYSNGVTVWAKRTSERREIFVHKRNIDFIFHDNVVRDPLPLSSVTSSNVSAFRRTFNNKQYAQQAFHPDHRANPNRYISIDYNGERRIGIIQGQTEGFKNQSLTIDLRRETPTRPTGIVLERVRVPFSNRQALESVQVSDEAYQSIGRKYSGKEEMPMTGDQNIDAFRQAFNSGALTKEAWKDVRYIRFGKGENGLFRMYRIDKDSGTIYATNLRFEREYRLWKAWRGANSYPSGDDSIAIFSHYLEDVKVSRKEGRRYVRQTRKEVREEKYEKHTGGGGGGGGGGDDSHLGGVMVH